MDLSSQVQLSCESRNMDYKTTHNPKSNYQKILLEETGTHLKPIFLPTPPPSFTHLTSHKPNNINEFCFFCKFCIVLYNYIVQ